jgi:UDP-glucose 4-epimerase
VGRAGEISIRDLAQLVIRLLHSTSSIEYIPYSKAYAPGFEDMLRRKPVVDKLAKYVGFQPLTRLRQIVERTAESVQ